MTDFVTTILIVTILRGVMVLAGVAFAYMGYHLFLKGIYDTTSDLNAVWADKKIAIARAGPGIFFALFGVVVVATSVWRDTGLAQDAKDSALLPQTQQESDYVPPQRMSIDPEYMTVAKIIESSEAEFEDEWGMSDRSVLFNTYIRAQVFGIPPDVYNNFVTTTYFPVLKQEPGQARAQNLGLAHRNFFAGFQTLTPSQTRSRPRPQSLIKDGLGVGPFGL